MAVTIDQDQLSQMIFGGTKASQPTTYQDDIGDAATQAEDKVDQYAQHFTFDSTDGSPSVWVNWALLEAAIPLALAYKIDRVNAIRAQRDTAIDDAFNSYVNTAIDTTTINGTGFTIADFRKFIIAQCVRRKPRVWVDPLVLDSLIKSVMNKVWNRARWNFRRREITLRVTPFAVETATWTNGTLTLTQTAAFADYISHQDGDIMVITDGTNAVKGEYSVVSRTSDDAIVLGSSISATAGNLTTGDITGYLVTTRVFGLKSGTGIEAFESTGARRFYYDDGMGVCVTSATPDMMAKAKGWTANWSGRPEMFRVEPFGPDSNGNDRYRWFYWPIPDQTYTLRGYVLTRGPSLPTGATAATDTITYFPSEFVQPLRDLSLATVLESVGATGGMTLRQAVEARLDELLPIYDDKGASEDQIVARDVYGDVYSFGSNRFTGGGWSGAGGYGPGGSL